MGTNMKGELPATGIHMKSGPNGKDMTEPTFLGMAGIHYAMDVRFIRGTEFAGSRRPSTR